MSQFSQLQALRTRHLRSSNASLSSVTKRSSASLLSSGSDLTSTGSGARGKRPFKAISFFRERKQTATQEAYNAYQRNMRGVKKSLEQLVKEKKEIRESMEREENHIRMLERENREREEAIRGMLESLQTGGSSGGRSEPPSMAQIKKLSEAILEEGLGFKRASERPARIENEVAPATKMAAPTILMMEEKAPPDTDTEKIMEFQRNRMEKLVYEREDARLQFETIMANRDMLTRRIFDFKTALEALRLKKETLTKDSRALETEFDELLNNYAQKLGVLAWKNATVAEANRIASLHQTKTPSL